MSLSLLPQLNAAWSPINVSKRKSQLGDELRWRRRAGSWDKREKALVGSISALSREGRMGWGEKEREIYDHQYIDDVKGKTACTLVLSAPLAHWGGGPAFQTLPGRVPFWSGLKDFWNFDRSTQSQRMPEMPLQIDYFPRGWISLVNPLPDPKTLVNLTIGAKLSHTRMEPYHLRIWKSSSGAVFLIWAVRSFINGYDLTVINSFVH
jgi:hypothetical protein